MANAMPNPEPNRSGGRGSTPPSGKPAQDSGRHPSGLEPWDPEEALRQEMEKLTTETPALETDINVKGDESAVAEIGQLRAENTELRSIIAELKQLVDEAEASASSDAGWADRQKEYETILEEKSELIRSLHLKIKEMQEQRPAAAFTPKEDELVAMSEELDRERAQFERDSKQLDEDRRQIKEDEKIMTQQMREMEMQMSRERADLARQRGELQRINEEIRHELERIDRDGGLNERLTQLRQRHMDVLNRKGSAPPPPRPPSSATTPQLPPTREPDHGSKKKDSDTLRRFFFGQGGE